MGTKGPVRIFPKVLLLTGRPVDRGRRVRHRGDYPGGAGAGGCPAGERNPADRGCQSRPPDILAGILVAVGIVLFFITMLINRQLGIRDAGITDPTHLAESPD